MESIGSTGDCVKNTVSSWMDEELLYERKHLEPGLKLAVTLCPLYFCGVVIIVCSLALKRSVVFITCFPGALYIHDAASCLLFCLAWLTDSYCLQSG